MNIDILTTNIKNNPDDFSKEDLFNLFIEYGQIEYKKGLKFNNKQHKMTNVDRKNIVSKVRPIIRKIKGFDDLLCGEKEVVIDKYIGQACNDIGFTLSDFYAVNGDVLYNLLADIN